MRPTQEQIAVSKDTVKNILKMFIDNDTDHDVALVSLATALSVVAHGLGVPRDKLCQGIGEAWDFVDQQEKGIMQ